MDLEARTLMQNNKSTGGKHLPYAGDAGEK